MKLAQARHIGAILVTELSRWGRSTQDLLDTLNRLSGWRVSVVAMSGMTFEVDTPHWRMMATMLAGIAQSERDTSLANRQAFKSECSTVLATDPVGPLAAGPLVERERTA